MAASVGVEIGDPLESRVAWLLGGFRGVPVLSELLLIDNSESSEASTGSPHTYGTVHVGMIVDRLPKERF